MNTNRAFVQFTMKAEEYVLMKQRAESLGESAAGFIKKAVSERMKKTAPKIKPILSVGEIDNPENNSP